MISITLDANENRALRLRETATAAQYLDETSASTSPAHNNGVQLGFLIGDTSPQRNRFNQQASDQLPSNRAIPDTRNQIMAEKPSSTSSLMQNSQKQQQHQQHQQHHCCELCGKSGLTDDTMRDHMKCHIDGSALCPFCGMTGVAPAELLLHVNQAHLDYLTPENELMSFIDDQSPSIDGDSDSLSEFRDISPMKSPMIDETATNISYKVNGFAHNTNTYTNQSSSNGRQNGVKQTNGKDTNGFHDKKDNQNQVNGSEHTNGFHSSPLRSQLGLNLKSSTTPVKKSINPLTCPICPYSSDDAAVLEEHINRLHFDPLSPSVNSSPNSYIDTLNAFACPLCSRAFETSTDLELHVNIEHRDILSPGNIDTNGCAATATRGSARSICPVCGISLDDFSTSDMELHIEKHFAKSPQTFKTEPDIEKEAQKLREQREFEMLRAQYGMDNQGNFREQSAAAMQSAVYAGEMSVADYYERQVGLRAAESHGIDDNTSCTKSVIPRIAAYSASSPGVIRTLHCSSIDHYASSYGEKGWGCGYRNLQMMLSSLLQNTTYYGAIRTAWNSHTPARSAMPSISKLQKLIEAAWAQGFDVQGSEQLGCKLYNTRKWIGATEVVTLLSSLRINCQLVDFHRPTTPDGSHSELFDWVLRYFEEKKQQPPLYLQHQGHSRTIIGIEQRASGLTLLVLDPSHGPRQVAALGSSRDSLRLIRRNMTAMRAPQYQIVAVRGLFESEEQYQASKILRSLRIPAD